MGFIQVETSWLSWAWTFLINVPLGLVVFDSSDPAAKPLAQGVFAREIASPGTTAALATEAGRALIMLARMLGHKTILAGHAVDNPASGKVLQKLGFRPTSIPAPPSMDRGLQQAWMLATPASASAIGLGPELGPPPRLRTWVAGGPRWDRASFR